MDSPYRPMPPSLPSPSNHAPPPPTTLHPNHSAPFHGAYIQSTRDLAVFMTAFRMGRVFCTSRRPTDVERKVWVRSGSIFIFEEGCSGIKRWTDGKVWSPSRILANFLIYRELDPSRPDPTSKGTRKSCKVSQARPDGSAAQEQEEEGPVRSRDDEERWRALVGSLRSSSDFLPGGLVKKTITLLLNQNTPHRQGYHIICYYSPEDVMAGRLLPVSQLPAFRDIEPEHEWLDPLMYRFPPKTETDEDGRRRYITEFDDTPAPRPPIRTRIQLPLSPLSPLPLPPSVVSSLNASSRAPLPEPVTASSLGPRSSIRGIAASPSSPAKIAPRYDPYGVNLRRSGLQPAIELSIPAPLPIQQQRPTLVSHDSSTSVASLTSATSSMTVNTTATTTTTASSAPTSASSASSNEEYNASPASANASTPHSVPTLSPSSSTDRELSVSPQAQEYHHAQAQAYYYPMMHPVQMVYPPAAAYVPVPVQQVPVVDQSAHGAPSPFYPSSAVPVAEYAGGGGEWYAPPPPQRQYYAPATPATMPGTLIIEDEEDRKPFVLHPPYVHPQAAAYPYHAPHQLYAGYAQPQPMPQVMQEEEQLMYPAAGGMRGYAYAPYGSYWVAAPEEGAVEVGEGEVVAKMEAEGGRGWEEEEWEMVEDA